MKNRVWFALLVLSLATNVWLVSRVSRGSVPSTTAAPVSFHPEAAGPAASHTASAANGSLDATAASQTAPPPHVLERLRTARSDEDIRRLVGDLRGAGLPSNLIRAWVVELIKPRFAGREPSQPFWRRNAPTAEFVAASMALAAERQVLLEELLGADALPAATLTAAQREMRYGSLSDEKLNAVVQIEREYDEVRAQTSPGRETNIRARMNSEVEQQRLLEQEKLRDLAALLSPEEMEQYALRNSRTAQSLMRSLGGLDVTADEFAALYRLQHAVEQNHPLKIGSDPDAEAIAARMNAADEANQKARAVLPDDRYYQYLESVDFGYASVARFAAGYPQISRETTLKVHRLQTELQGAWQQMRRGAARGGGKATPPDTQAFDARLVELLGPDVAAAYKKQGFGRIFVSTPGGG